MKTYSQYKHSNIDWIGHIPSHWEIKKLKHESIIQGGFAFKSDEFGDEGIPIIRIGDISPNIDLMGCKKTKEQNIPSIFKAKKFDTLIALSGATVGKMCVLNSDLEAYINQRVVRVTNGTKWMYYVLNSDFFIKQIELKAGGSAQENISTYDIAKFYIPIPKDEEQIAISKYLDEKTTQIDSFISKKLKLIELLKEERMAIINHAVSGEGKNWERKKLKYIGQAIIGITYSPDDVQADQSGILVLRSSNIQESKLSFLDNVYVNAKVLKKHLTQAGDILICARNGSAHLVGKCALIDTAHENLTWGAFMSIFRSDYGGFLYYYFNSDLFRKNIGSFSTSTVFQLTSDTLHNLVVSFPRSDDELKDVISILQKETARIDNTISKIEKEIELIQEYRTALISEAVTGKIKVI